MWVLNFCTTPLQLTHYQVLPVLFMQLWHSSAAMKAENLLQQLLFGLESILSETLDEFRKIIREKFEIIKDLNIKKIQLKCSEAQRRAEVS